MGYVAVIACHGVVHSTIGSFMSALLRLLHYSRQSGRLIQSVLMAFVLSLGVAIAAPAVQAANLTPDQQIICVGSGGMKVITFAADGTALETQTTHSLDCPLCMVPALLPPATQSGFALPAIAFAQPMLHGVQPHSTFESVAPPARAPPLAS
jgi:hypothetical protein